MTHPGIDRPNSPRRGRPNLWAVAIVLAVAGAMAAVPAASAQAAGAAGKNKDKTVVQVVTRTPEGSTSAVQMLDTVKGKGASLYTAPASGCTGGCLKVWPPLYVAKGKTPTGVTGLGTMSVMVGKKTKFQVTYMGKALYSFVDDSGTSVNGNGVGGFMVAAVS